MAMPTAMALPSNPDVGYYGNALKGLLTSPSGFSADPGYQFAFDQAMQATKRANSGMLGSGNIATALQDRAAGLASQAYDTRVNQLSSLLGQNQNYDVQSGQNAIGAQNSANNYDLGQTQNANTATRNANDLAIGMSGVGVNAIRNANDFALGLGQNANTAQRNANDYGLGEDQIGLGYFNGENNYNLGQQQNATSFYNAQTNRGTAESNAYLGGQGNSLDWRKYYDTLYPRQRVAGQP